MQKKESPQSSSTFLADNADENEGNSSRSQLDRSSPTCDVLFSNIVMKELRTCQWYWGAISAKVACRLLRGKPVGTFLVRDSRSEDSIFSVSYVTSTGIFHSRLPRYGGHFCLGGPNSLIQSASLNAFINQTVESSLSILMHNTKLDSMAQPVSLRHPLCRTSFLPSLKYFCRLTIVHSLADAGGRADQLPLPPKLQRFIRSPTYLCVC